MSARLCGWRIGLIPPTFGAKSSHIPSKKTWTQHKKQKKHTWLHITFSRFSTEPKDQRKIQIFTTPTLYFYSFQSRTTKNRCNTHFLTNIADECRTYPTLQRGEQLHQYTKYTLIIITSYLSLLLLHGTKQPFEPTSCEYVFLLPILPRFHCSASAACAFRWHCPYTLS